MKTIYKSLMTIAFAGLCLASCDKELKEDTAMEVGVVTDSNVSFDGKTVTVKKGSPVTFSFDGDPDFITFFSGEIDHEYKFRNRTEMKIEDIEKCEINFDMVAQYDAPPKNTPQTALDIFISDNFPGMAKNNFEADKLLVEGFDWTYLIPTEELPVKVESNTKSYSYTKDLASYLGKQITIAFHYKGGQDGAVRQPKFSFNNIRIELAFNNNKSETVYAKNLGFTPLNIVNNESDQQSDKVKDREYGAVDGGVPGFWKTVIPTEIIVSSSAAGTTLKNSWLISEPLLLNGSCNPDAGVAIKNISQSLEIYSHTYEEAGTYTATFVANNANYVHQGGQVVRELTINVVE